jgi:hypothetical protein
MGCSFVDWNLGMFQMRSGEGSFVVGGRLADPRGPSLPGAVRARTTEMTRLALLGWASTDPRVLTARTTA